jgi:hypothetical protein
VAPRVAGLLRSRGYGQHQAFEFVADILGIVGEGAHALGVFILKPIIRAVV